ncbi:MAG: hypothetical protein LBR06_01165 [Bacteroidales bacterium]|nr:hypothetical protein [Bacteroidales bacterium]
MTAALLFFAVNFGKAESVDSLALSRLSVELAGERGRYVIVRTGCRQDVRLKVSASWLLAETLQRDDEVIIKLSSKNDNASGKERTGTVTVTHGSQKQRISVIQCNKGDCMRDGDIVMLRQHTRGNGVAVVISGDGFDCGDLKKGGYYESECRNLVDTYMFTNPIFADFEELFDVYMLACESHERGVLKGTDNTFGSGGPVDFDKAAQTITAYGIPENRAWIFMGNGQIGGYALFEHRAGIYSTLEPNKPYWMAHEFVGHGFTLLADEYVSDCDYMGGPAGLVELQKNGWCMNVAPTSEPEKVPWKDFIGRRGYGQVGLYQGGHYCAEGIWRPEDYSIMVGARNDGKPPYYNAQSRWLIYKKIHELAGIEHSFESFIEYDKKFLE